MKKLLLSMALVLSAEKINALNTATEIQKNAPIKSPVTSQLLSQQGQNLQELPPITIDLGWGAAIQAKEGRARYDQLKAKPISARTVAEQNEMDALSKKLGLQQQ